MKKKKKRQRQRAAVLLVFVLLIILVVVAGIAVFTKLSSSGEAEDLNAYYHMELDTNSETNSAVLLNGQLSDARAIVSDGGVYLSLDFVQEYLNKRFYWEDSSDLLIFTTPTDVIKISAGDSNYYVGNSQTAFERVIFKEAGGTAYISAEFVRLYAAFDYELYTEPNRVLIHNIYNEDILRASVKKNTVLRSEANKKSSIVTDLVKGDILTILDGDSEEDWTYVITNDGKFGYIPSSKLGSTFTETATTDYVAPEYTSISKDYTINMAWFQTTNFSGNAYISDFMAGTDGINVLSPTWFYLDDNNGNIEDLASSNFVNYAHQNGIEVWALVSNFENSSVDTTAVLTNTDSREHLESQLISAAIEYKLDGINVDFESLSADVGDSFIQFLRELSILCRKNGIVLSVDNYKPEAYNGMYFWEEQGELVDYVIFMGYDEHYNGSGAGSVASIEWVRDGVNKMLSMVPANKLVLGMPFYTRLWSTDNASAVSSTAMGMSDAWAWVRSYGLEPLWDDESGQYYIRDIQGNTIYEMWLEDAESISMKVQIARNNNLAGTSVWKLGMENNDVWASINR